MEVFCLKFLEMNISFYLMDFPASYDISLRMSSRFFMRIGKESLIAIIKMLTLCWTYIIPLLKTTWQKKYQKKLHAFFALKTGVNVPMVQNWKRDIIFTHE